MSSLIKKNIIYIILIILSIIFFILFHILNFSDKIKDSFYDSRCDKEVKFLITSDYKIGRLDNIQNINFSYVNDLAIRGKDLDYLVDYLRYKEFNFVSKNFKIYLDAYKKYININDVLITKIIPEIQNNFENKIYLNLTMGPVKLLSNLDNNKFPDLILGTSEYRCFKNKKIYYVDSSKINFKMKKNYISNIGQEIKDKDSEKVLPAFKTIDKKKLKTLINGQSKDLDILNQKIFNKNYLRNNNNLNLKSNVRLSKFSKINGDYLLNINEDKTLSIYNLNNSKEINSANLKSIKFNKIICLFNLPDFNQNNLPEFILCNDNKIYIIEPSANGIKFMELINNNHINKIVQFGSVGDYNLDGFNDIWFANSEAKINGNDKLGFLGLIDGSLIKFDNKNTKKLDDLFIKEIIGSKNVSNEFSVNGIGYTLPEIAGDFDKDGIKDLLILHHFSYLNSGSLHILSGKKINTLNYSTEINDKDFIYILSSFNSYLGGTNLFANIDFDKDGYDDIVVPADVDHESGWNSGALYILSGKKILDLSKSYN